MGSESFNAGTLLQAWQDGRTSLPEHYNLRASIITTFNLSPNDSFVYRATASISLAQAQAAILHGGANGLHAWYLDDSGQALSPPPLADIVAYTSIFAPNTSSIKSLNSLLSNAKKGSLRANIASHLLSHRLLPSTMIIPRNKTHVNPYYDFWCWSCQALEWAGPEPKTVNVKTSHHILPIFMHHFGCVVPSYECLEIIKQSSRGRRVIEIGSGTGYWACLLRRHGVQVTAVDNLQSKYRTMWVDDTIVADGQHYIKRENGIKDAVLLLVYPIVGQGFSSKILKAYEGDMICVAGTQNGNGYTGFKDMVIDEYMSLQRSEFRKNVQVPLPSFAGKDEALFVFERCKEN